MNKKRVINAMKQTMSIFWEEFGPSIMLLLTGLVSLAVFVFTTLMGLYHPVATSLVILVLGVLSAGYYFIRTTIKNYHINNFK